MSLGLHVVRGGIRPDECPRALPEQAAVGRLPLTCPLSLQLPLAAITKLHRLDILNRHSAPKVCRLDGKELTFSSLSPWHADSSLLILPHIALLCASIPGESSCL